MYAEIFYFLVFLNLILFIWGTLTKNTIMLFIAICYTFFLSVLIAGTGIDYHLGNTVTLNESGAITGTTPIFQNFSPANDKGLWFIQWLASILSFCLIPVSGFFWIIKPKLQKKKEAR